MIVETLTDLANRPNDRGRGRASVLVVLKSGYHIRGSVEVVGDQELYARIRVGGTTRDPNEWLVPVDEIAAVGWSS